MRKILLSVVAACMLSAQAAEKKDSVDGRYYHLFAPFTFYHSVAGNMFSLDEERTDELSQAIDQAMLNVYLNRPDLVGITETEMKRSGTLRNDLEKPIEQKKMELTDNDAAPIPEERVEAPIEVVVEKPNFWKFRGDGYMQFMQNYVSGNWYKGGESNYSAVGALTLEANYDNKSKWKWENKLELKLGFQTSRTDTVHKFKATEDVIRYTGKVGLQAVNKWYYTLQVLAYTQFTQGFKSNNTKTFSDFMSPFTLTLGLGMDYKVQWLDNRLTGTINLSPLAVKYLYVDRKALASSFGVKTDENEHSITDFGSQVTASLTWKLNDVVTWKSRLYGFTSYHRAQLEWENTFALQVSKYITANLFLYPRFDDSNNRDEDLGYWQFKEYSSIGFSYNF